MKVLVLSAFLLSGAAFGIVQETAAPASAGEKVGVPLTLTGAVDSVYPSAKGLLIAMTVRQTVETAAPTRVERCHLSAVWFVPKPGQQERSIRPGEVLTLRGALVSSAGSAPGKSGDRQAGLFSSLSLPSYEVEGKLIGLTVAPPGFSARWLDGAQSRMDTALATVNPGAGADRQKLLKSIVFGGVSLDPQTKQSFLQSGLLHILAASGANVLLLDRALDVSLFALWRRLRLPFAGAIGFNAALIWFFAGLCGFVPSINRAAAMSTYAKLGQLFGRRTRVQSGLAVAAFVLSVASPGEFASASTALSFSATYAVALSLDKSDSRPQRFWFKEPAPKGLWHRTFRLCLQALVEFGLWAKQAFYTTCLVELYLLPLTIALFQQVTPFSLVSNFVTAPLLALLLPLSGLFVLVAAISLSVPFTMPVAVWLSQLSYGLLSVLVVVVDRVSAWPFSLLVVKSPSDVWLVAYYLLLWLTPKLYRAFSNPRYPVHLPIVWPKHVKK